jgi:hypothetical protein
MRDALNVTPEMEGPDDGVGEVDEVDPPHPVSENTANRNAATEANDEVRRGILMPCSAARTGPVEQKWLSRNADPRMRIGVGGMCD